MFLVNDELRILSVARYRLTGATLLNLFCHDCKDTKYLNKDFHNCVCHSDGWRDLDIDFKPSENILNAPKELKENASSSDNSGYSLRN
jgi:hypothetical protein